MYTFFLLFDDPPRLRGVSPLLLGLLRAPHYHRVDRASSNSVSVSKIGFLTDSPDGGGGNLLLTPVLSIVGDGVISCPPGDTSLPLSTGGVS